MFYLVLIVLNIPLYIYMSEDPKMIDAWPINTFVATVLNITVCYCYDQICKINRDMKSAAESMKHIDEVTKNWK